MLAYELSSPPLKQFEIKLLGKVHLITKQFYVLFLYVYFKQVSYYFKKICNFCFQIFLMSHKVSVEELCNWVVQSMAIATNPLFICVCMCFGE